MDYYKVLGVSKDIAASDLKKKYRELALKYHPDRNDGDKESEDKLKEINEAYSVLSDPQRRQSYDRFGIRDRSTGSGPPPDMSAWFNQVHQQQRDAPRRGADIQTGFKISLSVAILGGKREIQMRFVDPCEACGGSGGASFDTCGTCSGSGMISQNRGGMFVGSTCRDCGGVGQFVLKACDACSGRKTVPRTSKLAVTIPAGIKNGQRMALRGQGQRGVKGGPPGDVVLFIDVQYPTNLTDEQKEFIRGLDNE